MIKRFNDWIALNLTLATGTMWCVYLFTIIAVAPLVFPTLEAICMYISTTILQLILLPLIMVGTNILSQKSELRAQQDHEAVMEILREEHLTDDDLTEMKDRLAAIEKLLQR
jgi:hypothetical protein